MRIFRKRTGLNRQSGRSSAEKKEERVKRNEITLSVKGK